MHEIKVITIPENADKIYTKEYFENLGHKAAKELATFMRERLSEIKGE